MIVNIKQRYPTSSPICGQQHNLEDQSSLNTVLTYLSFQIINWSSINAINNVPTCESNLIITYGPSFDEHIFLHLNLLINELILYWLINTIPKHTYIFAYYELTFSINTVSTQICIFVLPVVLLVHTHKYSLSSWLRFHEFGMFLSGVPLLGRAATVLNLPPPPPGVMGIPIMPPPPDGFFVSKKQNNFQ